MKISFLYFIHSFAIILLAALFLYTGFSKLLNFYQFRLAMQLQPFPAALQKMVIYTLPPVEIIIAMALFIPAIRVYALAAYLVLMFVFCFYTGLVYAGLFSNAPCTCGGILATLTWPQHFYINLFFLLLAGWALKKELNNRLLLNGSKPKTLE